MSDNDAVWLKDPVPELLKIEGDLLVQRAPWPPETGDPVFGVTMCMGFALFRSRGQGMTKFQSEVDRLLHETGDDQVGVCVWNIAQREVVVATEYVVMRLVLRAVNIVQHWQSFSVWQTHRPGRNIYDRFWSLSEREHVTW